ncbi:putative carbohydrate esterase [Carex littledalei]|uniref:Putative carbohydrate esterase n=1 Tax=Carex littledalei TaxID=544730 RepID=A0A833V806_9POAL|nr:putative carbohydrate esterase [Carex littledalei]
MSGRGGFHWYDSRYQWDAIVLDECTTSLFILRLSVNINWYEARDLLQVDIESKSKTCGVGPGMSFSNCLLQESVVFMLILVLCLVL